MELENLMARRYQVLENLTKIIGPSGFERYIQKYYAEIMKPYVDSIFKDNIGNCYAEIRGNDKFPKILFNAHADTVGFLIKHIDDKGFVFVQDITGFPAVDYRMLPGTDVQIMNRKGKIIPGQFIPTIPLHHLDGGAMEESIDRYELLIDIGSKDREHAKKHVAVGDYVVLEARSRYQQLNGTHFVSANLDDRTGTYCMYRIAQRLNEHKSRYKAPIVFVSTVREEDWAGAASIAGMNIEPKISVTLDVSVATDTIRGEEDSIAQRYGKIELDSGPSIPRGVGVDDDTFLFLEKICQGKVNRKFTVPYQVEVSDQTVGVAENQQLYTSGRRGIKACNISVPCRNTHTRIETISLSDLECTIDLCVEFYKQVSAGNFKVK
jgi:endoglucanase